jgi:hypothetical protein
MDVRSAVLCSVNPFQAVIKSRKSHPSGSWVSNPAKILTVGLQSYGGEKKSNSIPSTHAALRKPHVPGLPKSRLSFRNLQLPIVRFVNLSQFL